MTSPSSSPGPTRYVIVWRETPSPSARLRTYTAHDDSPLSFHLSALAPPPTTILETAPSVDEYLQSDSVLPVAIPASLAKTVLGWEPTPSL